MAIIVILFLGLILFNIKCMGKEWNQEALAYRNTLAIRGICAIEIMLGHIGLALPEQFILYPFRKAGILIVGVFFFFSGYGLMHGLKNKNNYLVGFLKRRLKAILVPTFLVCAISASIYFFLLTREKTIIEAGIFSLKSINWYVWEIIGCYVAFYVSYKVFDEKRATVLIWLLSLLFIVLCYIIGASNPWYGSTLCFPLGLSVAKNKELFWSWAKKFWGLKSFLLVIVLGISIVTFFVLPERSVIGAIVSRNIASLSFVLLVTLLLYKTVVGNCLTDYLGRISFEIYLVHPLVIGIYHSAAFWIENATLFAVSVILTSVLLAAIMNKVSTIKFSIKHR